ncbi:hypothetical protein SLEP1_g22022 [Rubroshorea leprosula]|uniref:Uncharacterized protein n=1 Tax=Rubroshorea leprosula TaxID=152421 RepID=A0AAV5JH52_9ROSI|nr:hypothetical protein SLEP1_g22022 [Rubroshorea leprosula]
MSLINCLTCQDLQRTNSDINIDYDRVDPKPHFLSDLTCCLRSWSENPRPPPYEQIYIFVKPKKPYERVGGSGPLVTPAKKVIMKSHRRINSTGAVSYETGGEPRLVRSSGMRRDWSFLDDLREEKRILEN